MTGYTSDLASLYDPKPDTVVPVHAYERVNDNFAAIGTWVADPDFVWDGSSSTPTVGNGTARSDYVLLCEPGDSGGLFIGDVYVEWGSTTNETGTGDWTFSLPSGVEFLDTGVVVGGGDVDNGTTKRAVVAKSKTVTTFEVYVVDLDASADIDDTPLGTNWTEFPIGSTSDAVAVTVACPVKVFQPTDVSFHSLWWAGGPQFAAVGLGDGDSVSSWPNEVLGVESADAGQAPTFRFAADLAYRPAVDFDDANAERLLTGTMASPPDWTSGVTVVFVAESDTTNDANVIVDGDDATRECRVEFGGDGDWYIRAGTTIDTGTSYTAGTAYFGVVFFPGATVGGNSEIKIDGSSLGTFNAGQEEATGFELGRAQDGANPHDGTIALVGIYEGDLRGTADEKRLWRWAQRTYGTS